jgi:hypothetical protein
MKPICVMENSIMLSLLDYLLPACVVIMLVADLTMLVRCREDVLSSFGESKCFICISDANFLYNGISMGAYL